MSRVLQALRRRRAALALLAALPLAWPPAVLANPAGEAVRHGSVRFERAPGQLRVHQSSQRAVIDWQSFSIAPGETTRFLQPDAAAAALNRVRGPSASLIEGALRANGQVYLINPNGILVGPGGTVDVAGFVASTLDVSDRAFLAGGDLRFAGSSAAAVVNLGSISAFDGDVVLIASSVTNAGTIRAPRGTAALAAGSEVLLTESGEERVFVRGKSRGPGGVSNTGTVEANIAELKAHGGNVYGMAVRNDGRVAATGVTRQGGQIFLSATGGKGGGGSGAVRSTGTLQARQADGSGGRIVIEAGAEGRAEVGGTVDASGAAQGSAASEPGGVGGEILVLGRHIEVFDGALILNDGAGAGGTTRIGGGRRGLDPALSNAEDVRIGSGARISASARGFGEGGEVAVFASDTLRFDGNVSVAGAGGGAGGFVELSGQRAVFIENLSEQVDLGMRSGPAGTLLLDPIDVSVLSGINDGIVSGTSIFDGSIVHFLENSGNLVIATTGTDGDGDITLGTGVQIQWSSSSSLSFEADRDFAMSPGARIEATGAGSFSATAARSIIVGYSASISTTDGALDLSANMQINAFPGNFAGILVDGGTVQSLGLGAVTLAGRGGALGNGNHGVSVVGGGQVGGGTGGALTITGLGGDSIGSDNRGVSVSGGSITSLGATVTIHGTGGGSGGLSSGNSGIFLSNGSIHAGSGGDLDLVGLGGGGEGNNNKGIWVSAASVPGTISTLGGALSLSGTGGGTGPSSNNQGVDLAGAQVLVSATGGALSLTGTGGANTATEGIRVSGTVTTPDGDDIEFVADGISILTGTTDIDSGAGATSIRPLTPGFAVNLGGSDLAGVQLGITDAELDRITAALVRIGDAATGPVTVSAAITHANNLSITSGAGITVSHGIAMAADRSLGISTTSAASGSISLSGANAQLSAAGTGTIFLDAARNLHLGPGSGIATEDGNLVLSANTDGTAAGDFIGILLSGAMVQTGTALLSVAGSGGSGGISLDGGSGLHSGGGLFLSGTALAGNNPGIFGGDAGLSAGGGSLHLRGSAGGSGPALSFGFASILGESGDELFFESLGGAVEVAGQLTGYSLRLRDETGTGSVAFGFTHWGNDIEALAAGGAGPGLIGSLEYRDANGFAVTELATGESGIRANGDVVLISDAASQSTVAIEREIVSLSGDVLVEGRDVEIDAPISAGGDIAVRFGSYYPATSGTATIRAELLSGGRTTFSGNDGNADTLRFDGYLGPQLVLEFDDLDRIEHLVGPGRADDRLVGPAAAASFLFAGGDAFELGGTSVSGFPNVVGGAGDDLFSFASGASLSGQLDGGGGSNTLDYSAYGSPVTVNVGATPSPSSPSSTGAATGLGGGFLNLANFVGSAGAGDSFFGPAAGTVYQITGANAFSGTGFAASGFENLTGGPGADTFLLRPGGRLGGTLRGGAGTDTLSYASFGSAVTVNVGLGTATALGGFAGIERLVGSSGNDTFNFYNQATVDFVDGGPGNDTLRVDDSRLRGNRTYTVSASGIDRNPSYRFANIENVRLRLGPGDNTVNSGFFGFNQFLVGGRGFNTLNLPGVDDLGVGSPVQNVHFSGFSAPYRAALPDQGDLLQNQSNRNPPNQPGGGSGSDSVNRFNSGLAADLQQQFAGLGGAFPAAALGAIAGQALVVVTGDASYLVLRAFALDASGLTPSNFALGQLSENLGIAANLELAAALGFDGAVLLLAPDGPWALDLEGPPEDPAVIAALLESLGLDAARELAGALGLPLVLFLGEENGAVAIAVDAAPVPEALLQRLAETLAGEALEELNAALGG